MSNYDHFVLGVGNSLHPANQEETEIELTIEEQMENEICDLERKIQELTIRIKYREAVNKKIVELCQAVCGDNTYIFNKLKEIK
jgi:hypothetical protein